MNNTKKLIMDKEEVILISELPYCPKFTIFLSTTDGKFFYNPTNKTSQSEKEYIFSKLEILNNPEFFILINSYDLSMS